MDRLERWLDGLGLLLMRWWVWPLVMLLLGLATLLASGLATPGPHESVMWFGQPMFPPCPVRVSTGIPCGQCGMTRSFAWAARGQLVTSFWYNPAGLLLWGALVGGGLVGACRLWRRDPDLWRISWRGVGLLALAWLVVYAVGYEARRWGFNPLP